jgi:peptidoglycan/xylan/chitin deacetylase (PgdA/CDA1 family)/GT2 family glycosyltransferase
LIMADATYIPADLRCSVVVTTWKRPILLRSTLDSLMRQSYSNLEVIVVCDGEDHDVRAIADGIRSEIPMRWIFHPENRGLPAARNTGAHEAQGDIVLFLDDDVLADPELVAVHMQHHQAASPDRRIAVCCQTIEDRHTPLQSYVDRCLYEAWTRTLDGFHAALSESEANSVGEQIEKLVWFGLNCSMRRNQFIGIGGFNEFFRASDEEMELGLRLHLAGVEVVFEPRRLLVHKNAKELKTYFQNAWRASGSLDPYRVFTLDQRNAQTQRLVSIFHGYLLDRMTARLAWHLSEPLRSLANTLEAVANRTERHSVFGAWARISQAGEYWSQVKAGGCTLKQMKNAVGAPKCALTLHSICDPRSHEESTYYLRPQRFRQMMRLFRLTGHKTATLAQWLKGDVPAHHVLLTFDDGYDDLFQELLPFVMEHRYTPVIFLVADRIGASNIWDQASGLRARNLLTLEQIREMQKYGVEFGSHTLTHPYLPSVSDSQLRREVSDSRHRLQDMLGTEVSSFAYPFGGVDRRVRAAVADAGYKVAFSTMPGSNWWNDPLCQLRAEVNEQTTLLDFFCQMRSGRTFTQSVSARLRSLEQQLPTKALRSLVGGVRSMGHEFVHGAPDQPVR